MTVVGKPCEDSGARISYGEDGASREPTRGKGRYDLISPIALERLAIWYESGAEKYADRNWEKGMPISRCYDSMSRHANKWLMGEDDEDHLAAVVWNAFAIMHFEKLRPDLMDIPTRKEIG